MIYLVLPLGSEHGWGVCGKYIAREMSRFAEVTLLTPRFDPATVGDPLDHADLARLLPDGALVNRVLGAADGARVEGPVLNTIRGKDLLPAFANVRGTRTIGYTFFEDNRLPPDAVSNARRFYDHVATGSAWCSQVLRDHGYEGATTVLQGVDTGIFHPNPGAREYFLDRFVIFSGGKFELRKGQDLVIRAVAVMQQRHPDVMLINAWYSMWPGVMETMRSSQFIRFAPASNDLVRDYLPVMNATLADNGVDLARTLILPAAHNGLMPRIYWNTDIGLFPNRCEGGSNLVLMEYMACGKPVVASYTSGQKDVLTEQNALLLRQLRPLTITDGREVLANWEEAGLDEIVERLEWAYQNRGSLAPLAAQAATDMARLSWTRTARQFHELLAAPNP